MGKKKAAFLDRDGVINIDKNYLYKIDDFEYLDGAIEGMKKLQDEGYMLVVITNQSGIGRGFFSEEDYLKLQEWMINDLKEKGITISRCYYCPHLPDAKIPKYRCVCKCRKPGTELFYRAASDLDIDMDKSIAIGDKERDLAICKETKVKGFLLKNGWNDLKI